MDNRYQMGIEEMNRYQDDVLKMQHEEEKEEIQQNCQKEMELLESRLRNEQLNLLRTLTFEKNEIEKEFQEILDSKDKELEDNKNRLCEANEELTKFREERKQLYEELLEERNKLSEVSHYNRQLQILNVQLQEKCDQNIQTTYQDEGIPVSDNNAFDTKMPRDTREMTEDQIAVLETLKVFNFDEDFEHEVCEKLGKICTSIRKEEQEKAEQRLKDKEAELDNKYREEIEKILQKHKLEKEEMKMGFEEKIKTLQKNTAGSKTLNENISFLEKTIRDKDAENELLREKYQQERREIIQTTVKLKKELKVGTSKDEQGQTENTSQSESSLLKNIVNAHIRSLQILLDDPNNATEEENDELSEESFKEQLRCLDHVVEHEDLNKLLQSNSENRVKLNELLQNAKRQILWSCNIEKLKIEKKSRERERKLHYELVKARNSQLERAVHTLKLFDEGYEGETEKKEKLETPRNGENAQEQMSNIERDSPTEQNDSREDLVAFLCKEKENLTRALEELSKEFKREKEELLQKNYTQHREYVMSDDAEIIEKLLRQKTSLEDALNLERFYLSRIYYLELNEELQELLTTEKDSLRKRFDQDKLEIVLKYSKEIADLQKTLSEKENRELELLEEKDKAIRKVSLVDVDKSSEIETIKRKF